jgi:hypothetical protein
MEKKNVAVRVCHVSPEWNLAVFADAVNNGQCSLQEQQSQQQQLPIIYFTSQNFWLTR